MGLGRVSGPGRLALGLGGRNAGDGSRRGPLRLRGGAHPPGQNVYAVGSIADLGGWDPERAVLLSPVAYPVWQGSIVVPPNSSFEWKCVKREELGGHLAAGTEQPPPGFRIGNTRIVLGLVRVVPIVNSSDQRIPVLSEVSGSIPRNVKKWAEAAEPLGEGPVLTVSLGHSPGACHPP